MFYFYILYSMKDEKMYYGFSSDLQKRIQDHISGDVDSTKHRRPLKLIYYEAYEKEEQARKREREVKVGGRLRKELKERLGLK
jgi:putative endonuclease